MPAAVKPPSAYIRLAVRYPCQLLLLSITFLAVLTFMGVAKFSLSDPESGQMVRDSQEAEHAHAFSKAADEAGLPSSAVRTPQQTQQRVIVCAAEFPMCEPVGVRPTGGYLLRLGPSRATRRLSNAGEAARLEAGKELDISVQQPGGLQVERGPLQEGGANRIDDGSSRAQPYCIVGTLHTGDAPPVEREVVLERLAHARADHDPGGHRERCEACAQLEHGGEAARGPIRRGGRGMRLDAQSW